MTCLSIWKPIYKYRLQPTVIALAKEKQGSKWSTDKFKKEKYGPTTLLIKAGRHPNKIHGDIVLSF